MTLQLTPPPHNHHHTPFVAPSAPGCVYWRPYNERARQTQRQPQASPGGPCLTAHNPSSSRISTACSLVHMDQSVSSSRIHLLCRLPALIPPRLSRASLSGVYIKGCLAIFLQLKRQCTYWQNYVFTDTEEHYSVVQNLTTLAWIKSRESEKAFGGG